MPRIIRSGLKDFSRFDFRCCFAYHAAMDKPRENGILVIAASIIAVIRLRGQDIRPSPKLVATIKDSVNLARLVLAEVERRG